MSHTPEDSTFVDSTQKSGAATIEQHGIDFIPEKDRKLTIRDLFMIWFGANVIYLTSLTARSSSALG